MMGAIISLLLVGSISVCFIRYVLRAETRLMEAQLRLNKLRRNCFLTNERGHRVKYWNASESVRERAEG